MSGVKSHLLLRATVICSMRNGRRTKLTGASPELIFNTGQSDQNNILIIVNTVKTDRHRIDTAVLLLYIKIKQIDLIITL